MIYLSLRKAAAWVPRPALAGWVRTLGLVTYPYYLIHEILGGAVLHQAQAAGLGPAAGLGTAMLAIGLLAFLIARYGKTALRQAIGKAIGGRRRVVSGVV